MRKDIIFKNKIKKIKPKNQSVQIRKTQISNTKENIYETSVTFPLIKKNLRTPQNELFQA